MSRLPVRPQLLRTLRHAPRAPSVRLHTTSSSSPASASINSSEVDHFHALASEWWDPHGPSSMLFSMNPWRHAFIKSCRAAQPDAPNTAPNSLRYLDVGCGGGIFAESAARLPSTQHVTAIDPTSELIAVARNHARRDPILMKQGRLDYLNTAIEDVSKPQPEQAYDIVSLWEVIEHVNNPSAFLDQVAPFVKPGGWFVLSTIARTWPSWFTTKFAAEELLRIVPRGTHDWNKYINEPELRAWFFQGSQAGQWETPRSMGLLPLPGIGWREVSSPGDHWGNYLFGVRRSKS